MKAIELAQGQKSGAESQVRLLADDRLSALNSEGLLKHH